MTELSVGRRAAVRAPATSANLGPGFDALGLALSLWDNVEAEVAASGVEIDVQGEGAGTVARDDSNLVVRAMRVGFEAMGVRVPGLRLACRNRIPHGRGLGSSAAAIVGGLRLASSLAGDGLSHRDILVLASDTEGHADNVAACLHGGLTIAYADDGVARAVRLDVDKSVSPIVFVPAQPVSTEVARGLLPNEVSHRDAAANAARTALLVAALTDRPDLLFDATEDRLHQAYREPAMPASIDLVARMRAEGHAAVVSGAGPTVLVLATQARPISEMEWAPPGWRATRLAVDSGGVAVVG